MAFQTNGDVTFDPARMLYWQGGQYVGGNGSVTAPAAAADASYKDVGGGLFVNPAQVAVVSHAGFNPASGNGVTFVNGVALTLTQAQYNALKAAL